MDISALGHRVANRVAAVRKGSRNMNDPAFFANDWLASWNAHDLERILLHYAPEIVFLSPLAQKRVGNGRVEGIVSLRAYWRAGLEAQPDLHFELLSVLQGHQCLTITYTNHRNQIVAETFEFGRDGKVVRAFACYGQAAPVR